MSKINLTVEQQIELDNILDVCKKAFGANLTKKQIEEITNVFIGDIEATEAKAKIEAQAKEKADAEMHKRRLEIMMPHNHLNKA
jgi:hypothetical protein